MKLNELFKGLFCEFGYFVGAKCWFLLLFSIKNLNFFHHTALADNIVQGEFVLSKKAHQKPHKKESTA